MRLDHRQHRLARARHVTGKQKADTVDLKQPLSEASELLGVGSGIIHHRLDRATEHTARSIDLLDRKQGRVELGTLDPRRDAGLRKQHADAPVTGIVFYQSHCSLIAFRQRRLIQPERRSLLPDASDWKQICRARCADEPSMRRTGASDHKCIAIAQLRPRRTEPIQRAVPSLGFHPSIGAARDRRTKRPKLCAPAQRGGMNGGVPEPFHLLVEQRHRDRASRHVERGDEIADQGACDDAAGRLQLLADVVVNQI